MSNFEQKKRDMIAENERKYGEEIRDSYGDQTVDASNAQLMSMSEADFNRMQDIGAQILSLLEQAVAAGLPADGEQAQHIADLHRQWLAFNLPQLTREMHTGIAGMYVADERFTAYYDGKVAGCAALLRDAVGHYWDAR